MFKGYWDPALLTPLVTFIWLISVLDTLLMKCMVTSIYNIDRGDQVAKAGMVGMIL